MLRAFFPRPSTAPVTANVGDQPATGILVGRAAGVIGRTRIL